LDVEIRGERHLLESGSPFTVQPPTTSS
jgi:hypothetical protein